MKLDYILSDTTKSATKKALSKVVFSAEQNLTSNYIVIVPETKSIIIEKELLDLSKNGAFANIFIYSFVRLLNRLGFLQKDKIVSKQTAVMLLRKIIYDNQNKLHCYKKTAKSINFAEKIYDTLQQFKSSEVGVEDLKVAILNCDQALKSKLEDIIIIYEAYENLLGDRLYDECDKLNLIKEFVGTSEFFQNSEIYVVGFDNITPEMISVFKEIAKNVKSITFSSVYFSEKREDKYIQKNDLYFKFRRVADSLNYPYIPMFKPSYFKGDFYSVANNLFLPIIKKVNYNGDIKVFEAETKEQELKFVAAQIYSLIQNGERLKNIGVLLLDLEKESKLLEKIFNEYNINYFINKEINISNHSLVLFIKNCFEIYLSHLSYDKIFKFLKSKFVDEKNIFEFENFIKEYGFNYNDFLKPLDKKYENKLENYNDFVNILDNFQCFYVEFAEKMQKSEKVLDYCELILWLLNYFNIENKLIEISDFESKQNLRESAEISKIIYSKVIEFLSMTKNFLGEINITADEFLQIFLTGFSTQNINLVPVSVDCVIVQNNTDGFYDIKHMFIVGADEDNFPMIIRDSGVILDDEIEKTNLLCGKVIEPTTKEINAREKFIAYESLLEPSSKLFVSYSKQGIDGSFKKPSLIIKKLVKLFGDEVLNISQNKSNYISQKNFVNNFAKHINDFFDGLYLLSDINKEYSIIKKDLNLNFKNFLLNMNQGEKQFFIDNASELFFSNNKTSSSQLEKYFACPYLFFVTYGLKLKENKNAKISKLDVGVILHKVAEIFMKNINNFKNIDEKTQLIKIEDLIENIFDEFGLNKSKNFAAIKFLKKESIRFCKHLLFEQVNSGFKAKYNEFEFFGKNGLNLQLSNSKKIILEGKIDRIDEFGEYLRIIDYKTGSVDSDLFSIYYGKKIQLLSYLSAITSIKDKKIAGLLYMPIHSEFSKNSKEMGEKYKMNGYLLNDIEIVKNMDYLLSFDNPKSDFVPITIKSNNDAKNRNVFEFSRPGQKILNEEDFELLKIYNENLCKQACEEILEGFIEPSPLKKGDAVDSLPCKWCEFAGFCGLESAHYPNGRRCQTKIDFDSLKEMKEN